MEYKSLLYFIRVAKHSSFTKAAEELYISQSAISQAINHLEKELDVRLFNRGRQISLTRAGRAFLPEAERLYRHTSNLKERLRELKSEGHESLNFGISPLYGKLFLAGLMSHLEKSYPELTVNFIEDDIDTLEDMLCSGILDCALIFLPHKHANFQSVPVRTESVCIAVPKNHPIKDTPPDKPVSLALLKNERFIMTKPAEKFTALARSLCENAGFSPGVVYETADLCTVNSLVGSGIGVGLVPDALVSDGASDSPVYRRIDDRAASRFYVLARKKGTEFSKYTESFLSDLPDLFTRF